MDGESEVQRDGRSRATIRDDGKIGRLQMIWYTAQRKRKRYRTQEAM